jgi:hypothetical protein
MATEFVVVVPHIIGTLADWETVYTSDRLRHRTRDKAIAHGWKVHDHDDFLLAIVDGDQVIGTAWQYDDRDEPEELADIADALGLTVKRKAKP